MNIKFEGIDVFYRPIFKAVGNKNRYGSVDHLFDHDCLEDEVLKEITEDDLVYFGKSFGCEPWGTDAGNIKIVRVTK